MEAKQKLEENNNYFKTMELLTEQNANMIDGIPNNENLLCNQGYILLKNEIVGHMEYVLAENPTAPQPYATWVRNMENDKQSDRKNYIWGHYFCDKETAKEDFHKRVNTEKECLSYQKEHPSLLENLKLRKDEIALSRQELVQKKATKENER